MESGIFLGGGGDDYGVAQHLLLAKANRHGLIAGATGTGKTVTLQVLAEGFSEAGVPVFLSDVKGDLAGLAVPGDAEAKSHCAFAARAGTIGWDLAYRGFPVTFWDIFGEAGHPVRTTISEMGPLLLSRLMGLSEAQEGVLNIAFRIADEEGLALLDLKDLQAMLVFVGQNAGEIGLRYGNVAAASVGAIQRRLLVLEGEGAVQLFGEPALDLADLMTVDEAGRGRIGILAAERLMAAPRLYATFLLWLLSELFEELPEVGDLEKPRLVFFFDEAHLLFNDAPKALIEKVERVARLIRSKGVGVYFVTQSPGDVPEAVLAQLGNRVQHALRAFTPKDQRDLSRAAATYRPNPRFETAAAIRDAGTGEAVASLLDRKGAPGIVERVLVRPPMSRLGPLAPGERQAVIDGSPFAGRYDESIDRESAFERLRARAADAGAEPGSGSTAAAPREFRHARRYEPGAGTGDRGQANSARSVRGGRSDSIVETFGKSFARQLGTASGRALTRGVMGTILRGR